MRLTAVLVSALSLVSCAGRAPSTVVVERQLETEGLPTIAIRVVVQPEHRAESTRFLDATADSLTGLRIWSIVDVGSPGTELEFAL